MQVNQAPVRVIRPERGWVGLQLGELWRYRELLLFLAWRNVLIRYKQTALGFAWAILQPALLMVVMTLFFASFARRAGVPGPLYYYAGLVPWAFFANAVTQSANSLVGNAHLVAKVYFPRLSAPIAAVLAALVDFAAAFAVLVAMMIGYGIAPDPAAVVVVPGMLLLAVVSALGVGLWLSALNVAYRDVQYVVPFLIQIGLFASLFADTIHSQPWHTLLGLNPMAGVIEGFRWALVGAGNGVSAVAGVSTGVALLVLGAGAVYFRRSERDFADVI
jgi:lipopolysaccharide transport system permease protein